MYTAPKTIQGFTLLEMLLALALFAVLSMSAYQVLQGVLLADSVAQAKEHKLTQLQKALWFLEQDLTQMVPRSGRVQGMANNLQLVAEPFSQDSEDWGIAFVRAGWLNPDGLLPRSTLTRVGYRLKAKTLERLSYLYPDPAPEVSARIQPLLPGVTAFKLEFFDTQWRVDWPKSNTLPRGIAVELDVEGLGVIRRQFLIAAGGGA